MRRTRKEKPILQALLLSSLAINTTVGLVVLARRNHLAQATEKKEPVAAPAVITLEGATVEPKVTVGPAPSVTANPPAAKKTVAPVAKEKSSGPAKTETVRQERDEISFLRAPALYRLSRDTILVTRRDGARIVIPQGTLVRVAGFTSNDRALVISQKGNPDGLVARSSLETVQDEAANHQSSGSFHQATAPARNHTGYSPEPFRLSGGPHGGSIDFGGAQLHLGPTGQISGSLSR